VVASVVEGHLINLSELPGGRASWGRDLVVVAPYEQADGRPPLIAMVLHKADGRPGPGFPIAMKQVGYLRRRGESDDQFWKRAVAEVFAYWKPRQPTAQAVDATERLGLIYDELLAGIAARKEEIGSRPVVVQGPRPPR